MFCEVGVIGRAGQATLSPLLAAPTCWGLQLLRHKLSDGQSAVYICTLVSPGHINAI